MFKLRCPVCEVGMLERAPWEECETSNLLGVATRVVLVCNTCECEFLFQFTLSRVIHG